MLMKTALQNLSRAVTDKIMTLWDEAESH